MLMPALHGCSWWIISALSLPNVTISVFSQWCFEFHRISIMKLDLGFGDIFNTSKTRILIIVLLISWGRGDKSKEKIKGFKNSCRSLWACWVYSNFACNLELFFLFKITTDFISSTETIPSRIFPEELPLMAFTHLPIVLCEVFSLYGIDTYHFFSILY